MTQNKKNLLMDLGILFVSIAFAIWLSQSEMFANFLLATRESKIIGSLFGGLLFTSIFTTAPSIVLLGEVSQNSSIWQTALLGAFGALLGDLIMFKFLRDRVAKDFYQLFHVNMQKERIFRLPRFRWLAVLLGGLVIASPFPDELGLAILGFSNTKTNLVIPVSFVCNFLGILVIAFLATRV